MLLEAAPEPLANAGDCRSFSARRNERQAVGLDASTGNDELARPDTQTTPAAIDDRSRNHLGPIGFEIDAIGVRDEILGAVAEAVDVVFSKAACNFGPNERVV